MYISALQGTVCTQGNHLHIYKSREVNFLKIACAIAHTPASKHDKIKNNE